MALDHDLVDLAFDFYRYDVCGWLATIPLLHDRRYDRYFAD
jgi:hypothetical protein